jgi:glycosyltransferase involved in cell wall biosynthesis
MTRCLILAPFPLQQPRHGGQVRAASLGRALTASGWQVVTAGIYHQDFFPADQRGPEDLLLDSPALREAATEDVLFGDLIVARHAAQDQAVVERLRHLLHWLRPAVVQLEHPWPWLVLRQALEGLEGPRPKLVYSSHNIEWRMRPALYRLGLRRPGADAMIAATRALEAEVARRADLVLSISDLEAAEIAAESGREVLYLPPSSDLAEAPPPLGGRYADAARSQRVRYASLLSSAYWPNVEGFFQTFPEGLGFLRYGEQIWVGGQLGPALHQDRRHQDFNTLNDTRMQVLGHIADADKAAFLAGSECVIVPVHEGAGAKLKTADALASGRPVITTAHGIEGYGPLLEGSLGQGVYVADTPAEFRALIRRALRDGLPGCDARLREALRVQALVERMRPAYAALIGQ